MLVALKKYIENKVSVNLLELSQRFAISTAVARDMLALLQHKGFIEIENKACTTKCVQCAPEMLERFRWCSNPNP